MSAKQTPIITRSTLDPRRPKWFIVTRYRVTEGVSVLGADAGEKQTYLVASEKFNVTDQMEAILRGGRKARLSAADVDAARSKRRRTNGQSGQ